MLSRLTWSPKPKPKPKQLNKDRRAHLVKTAANILRYGEPTKFALESDCRHSLRAGLCLKGWSWSDADCVAAEIVAAALNQIGARRPTWQEGQPEYCQPGIIALARSRCVRCGWKLPEGHTKFCSRICNAGYHADRALQDDRAGHRAKVYAYFAEWSAKQPEQPCELCRTPFQPRQPGQRFCSKLCANRHNSGLARRYRKPLKFEAVK